MGLLESILKNLIEIDSNCRKSNKEIIDYIQNKLSKFECIKYKVDDSDIELYNLVVKIKGKQGNSPLVFIGHTDTVPPAKEWKTNPLNPIKEDGKIYGLGASDMKAGLAAMIYAALSLNKMPPQEVYLIFDADEEGEMRGYQDLIKKFSLNNARVIIAEPTSEMIITGQKGCMDLEIKIPGKAMHSSRADYAWNLENNANYKAIAVLNALKAYEERLSLIKDQKYGSPTNNIGVIQGGTAPNATSDNCIIKISRRLIPSEDINKVYAELSKLILKAEPKASIRKTFWGETFQTAENTEFIKLVKQSAKKILGKVKCDIKPSWTEAAIYNRWGEAIIFGPGDDSICHQANEYVKIKEIEKFAKIYQRLMNYDKY